MLPPGTYSRTYSCTSNCQPKKFSRPQSQASTCIGRGGGLLLPFFLVLMRVWGWDEERARGTGREARVGGGTGRKGGEEEGAGGGGGQTNGLVSAPVSKQRLLRRALLI